MTPITIPCSDAGWGDCLAMAVRAQAAANGQWFRANADWFAQHFGGFPSLLELGASYRLPNFSRSIQIASAAQILETPGRGWACGDMVAYECGRAYALGIPCTVWAEQIGDGDWHVTCDINGTPRDPAREVLANVA